MKKLNFNSWYSNILEAVNTPEPVATTTDNTDAPTVDTAAIPSTGNFSREEIISDIDTIMTNLSQLASQVKEELESIGDSVLNEAGEETAMDKIKDFLFAPKYRNMQKKINKMKMNALDMQIAADNLGSGADKPKKDAILAKKKTIDSQISDLQTAVDDKAKDRGSYVQKVIKSEKIKGRMELVKRSSGMEDDPKKKKDLASSMGELQKRYAEEQDAIKDLSDEAKAAKAEADKKAKEDAAAQAKKDNDAKAETDRKAKEETDKKAEEEGAKAEIEKLNIKKGELKAKKIAPEDKAGEAQNNLSMAQIDLQIAKLKKDDKAISTAQGKVGEFQQALNDVKSEKPAETGDNKENKKAELLKGFKKQLEDAKNAGDEEKVKNIQAKIDKISKNESWQLEGTELGRIYEMELKKLQNESKLNESKFSMSVADRMRVLLG